MRTILALLFFVSGLSSLVLQTVWTRLMVLAFGSTTFAVSTVLTAFMGGLAVGSALAGRYASRVLRTRRSGVLVYAGLELLIGLYALALPLFADALPDIHRAIWGEGAGSYYVFALLRFVIAAAILLLPTVAMGATLPVLAHVYCEGRDPELTGRRVGTLYAINTAGAVAGVLLAGFVLLPSIGLSLTNGLACAADVLLAVLALLLYRRWREQPELAADDARAAAGDASSEPRDGAAATAAGEPDAATARRLAHVALASVAVSGAMAMAYEVAWTRALSLVIGSSTYAFSLILACVLVGLAGGAALYARRQTAARDQAQNLALAHLLAALTAAAGVALVDDLPAVMLVALKKLTLTPSAAFALKFALCAIVVLLPSFFFGMIFPAVVRAYAALRRDPSRTTGTVYAINTLGAIVGAFAAGFVLVPALGLQATLMLLVGTGIALAGAFGLLAATARRRAVLAVVCFASLLVTLSLWRPWNLQALSSGVFRVSRYADVVKSLSASKNKRRGKRDDARTPRARRRWRALALRLIPPADVVDTFREPTAGSALVHHSEGVTTTVGISRSVDASLSGAACWVRHALLVNGKPDASLSLLYPRPQPGCGLLLRRDAALSRPIAVSPSGDMETQLLSGLLPRLLGATPRAGARALVIGWGSGITVHALLANSKLKVTAVELEREVVRAVAAPFAPMSAPVDAPRLDIVAEDGRNFLAATRQRFAMVVSEPSNPWMAGCGNLFTHEFFLAVRAHLQPGGVLLQWLQAYEIAPRNVASILATLHSVFDDVLVFGPVQSSADILLVARAPADASPSSRARRGRLHWPTLARRFAAVRRVRIAGIGALSLLGIEDPADIVVRLHAGSAGVSRVARGAPLNTDDNARIEFAAPRDLIEYRRYSPRAIVRRLRRAGARGAALVDAAPRDLTRRLCWARLRAGDAKKVVADPPAGAPRCLAAARVLAKVADPRRADVDALLPPAAGALAWSALGQERDAALAALEQLFAGDLVDTARVARRYAAFALMGHVEARARNGFEALLYLSAARHLAAQRLATVKRYRPLARLRAAVLAQVGQHGAAVAAAIAALEGP